jgi:hypothetical protein
MRLLILLGAALIGSSLPQTAGPAPDPRLLSDEERADCLGRGGRIGIAGLIGGEICIRPTADAGRSCTGRDECEGFCEYSAREGEPAPQPGARVAGQCQADTRFFGCHSIVEGGVLQPELCLD